MPSYSIVDILATALKNGKLFNNILDAVVTLSLSLQTYGAKVHQIKAEIGATVSYSEIEAALQSTNYKILTITHVDTSTGHLVPLSSPPILT
jgi:hypothetical protein